MANLTSVISRHLNSGGCCPPLKAQPTQYPLSWESTLASSRGRKGRGSLKFSPHVPHSHPLQTPPPSLRVCLFSFAPRHCPSEGLKRVWVANCASPGSLLRALQYRTAVAPVQPITARAPNVFVRWHSAVLMHQMFVWPPEIDGGGGNWGTRFYSVSNRLCHPQRSTRRNAWHYVTAQIPKTSPGPKPKPKPGDARPWRAWHSRMSCVHQQMRGPSLGLWLLTCSTCERGGHRDFSALRSSRVWNFSARASAVLASSSDRSRVLQATAVRADTVCAKVLNSV